MGGGWLDQQVIRLTSASVEVEVELSGVEAELGKIIDDWIVFWSKPNYLVGVFVVVSLILVTFVVAYI